MVDTTNPTSQFHPYRRETSTPATDATTTSGLGGLLGKLGIDSSKIGALGGSLRNTDLRGGLNSGLTKARTAANANPGMVLGGLAALAIGAGLLRKRSMGR
jgi:hypothetical protein